MEYLIVRNNRAPYKQVFEYMGAWELRQPTYKQKQMLAEICDSVEFIHLDSMSIKEAHARAKMNSGDWLFEVSGEKIKLRTYKS